MPHVPRRKPTRAALVYACAVVVSATALTAGCSAKDDDRGGAQSVDVLMVDNPQMLELKRLTGPYFTKRTGVRVHFSTLPENEVRERTRKDFSRRGGHFDVATISNYEAPIYARKKMLQPLDSYINTRGVSDHDDFVLPLQLSLSGNGGRIYGQPFYGESSFLMYRKDLLRKYGLSMPARPTWHQVRDLAAKLDGRKKGVSGICMRGLPGWGEMAAPLTTVVNTFGGTWFDKHWNARLDSPEFSEAARFYVDLARKYGQPHATEDGYTGCLKKMRQGESAMWYDSTAAAGSLEADDSHVKGDIGYVPAPVEKTRHSGWLYTWAFGMRASTPHSAAAWKFIRWATSKQYEKLVGTKLGWARVPSGKRVSTWKNPQYQKATKPFYKVARDSIRTSDPRHPGVQSRPTTGIQYVGIPEFQKLGTRVSEELSAAIDGRQSVRQALRTSQRLAEKVGRKYQHRGR